VVVEDDDDEKRKKKQQDSEPVPEQEPADEPIGNAILAETIEIAHETTNELSIDAIRDTDTHTHTLNDSTITTFTRPRHSHGTADDSATIAVVMPPLPFVVGPDGIARLPKEHKQ